MDFDQHLHHPFVMTCAGPTQCGKSTLIRDIILRKDEIIYPQIERVIFCYNEDEPPFADELKTKVAGIVFHKGLGIDVPEGNTIPTLIVLDDFMEEASNSKDVCAMCTRGSSHR